MTRKEFANIVFAIKSVFTMPSLLCSPESVTVWYESLKDLDYPTCHNAVMAYIQSEDKIPTPASIRKKIVEISRTNELNEMQAWALVSKALRNGGYHAQEEFEKLPQNVKIAVGSPEQLHNWATSDYNAIETVIQSNFMRTYRAVVEQKGKENTLSQSVKASVGIETETVKQIETGAGYEENSYR